VGKEGDAMALGKRQAERQEDLWIVAAELPQGPGHPFYRRLNQLLAAHGFDAFVEGLCQKFYHDSLGRPGIPPGVYFRLLLIGYFEGLDSERGIAWRCADSRTLGQFLGYGPTDTPPDHSSLSVIRNRIALETHQEVFSWVLRLLAAEGLLKGKTIGVDATTLEANAAMRSIVRKDTGESYQEFLTQIAKVSGIATPTREDLAKLDRKRKNKASNEDWENPHDPDAKITKMKDGRTHLAHKAEHAVDMDSQAIVAVTLQPADRGDTTSLGDTVEAAVANLLDVQNDPTTEGCVHKVAMKEVVADKGYHSNASMTELSWMAIRSYVSEPDRGERDWEDQAEARQAVYANRRRIRGERGRRLMRRRGEVIERSFAHCYETGGMRRTHLRGHGNILKRLLVHVAGFNLGLAMRSLFGIGKPRRVQDGLAADIFGLLVGFMAWAGSLWRPFGRSRHLGAAPAPLDRLPTAA
jgi:transposase